MISDAAKESNEAVPAWASTSLRAEEALPLPPSSQHSSTFHKLTPEP